MAAVLVADIPEAVLAVARAAVVLGSAAGEAESALAADGSRVEWDTFMGGVRHLGPVHHIVNRSIMDKAGCQVPLLDQEQRFILKKIVSDRVRVGPHRLPVRRSPGRISGL